MLEVLTPAGKLVGLLTDAESGPGYYSFLFSGNHPSGIYFCRLTVKDMRGAIRYAAVRKMILTK